MVVKKPKPSKKEEKGGNKKNGTLGKLYKTLGRAAQIATRPSVMYDAQNSNGERMRNRINRKSLQTAADAVEEALKLLELSKKDNDKMKVFISKVNRKLEGKSAEVQGAIVVQELEETSKRSMAVMQEWYVDKLGHKLSVSKKITSDKVHTVEHINLEITAKALAKLTEFITEFAQKMKENKVYEYFIEAADYRIALKEFLKTSELGPFNCGLVQVRLACLPREAVEEEVDVCKRIESEGE